MNKRVKRKWLKALRSGEYAQAKGALCEPDKGFDRFCCLGVLCDLYAYEKDVEWEQEPGCVTLSLNGNRQFLPREVFEWAGLLGGDPSVKRGNGRFTLSVLNDSKRNNLRRVADIIEAQL